ncbi:Neuroligin-3 [Orchesella cincta]|uniref:Neuroligin-3 n=1 Tax=Orchesella cincta TaxID=48709 RepID=A0A1D2MBT6_ORCCI|nr:Neuroligin-3 [Orchesella cincta]
MHERRGAGSRYNGGGENLGHDGSSPGGLAIVVILQGESWEWGSGNLIDGSALASYGHVMVITLNYRLGVLEYFYASPMYYAGTNSNFSPATPGFHFLWDSLGERIESGSYG